MIKRYLVKKNREIFYDIENKIIGRSPTNSNMRAFGSDNSIYLCSNHSEFFENVLAITNSNIDTFKKEWNFKYKDHDFPVSTNINNEGQVQIKVEGDGQIFKLLHLFNKQRYKSNEYLILFDFSKEIIEVRLQKDIMFQMENIVIDEIIQEAKDKKISFNKINSYVDIKLRARNSMVQGMFRQTLLEEFDNKCAICDSAIISQLIASHIVGYSKCKDIESRASNYNGLLLCKCHDGLFDSGLITFDENNGNIIILDQQLREDTQQVAHNINENISLNNKYLTNERKKHLLNRNKELKKLKLRNK